LPTNKSTKDNTSKSNVNNDTFDVSYSNQIMRHLDKVNMDPWYYIYSNYVNSPTKKSDSEKN